MPLKTRSGHGPPCTLPAGASTTGGLSASAPAGKVRPATANKDAAKRRWLIGHLALRRALERARQPGKTRHGQNIERHQHVESELERVGRVCGPEVIAERAQERGAEPQADQVHDQQQQRAGQHSFMGLHFLLHQRHRRREIEVVQEHRGCEEEERQRPARRPDEADEERNRQEQRHRGEPGVCRPVRGAKRSISRPEAYMPPQTDTATRSA